MNIKIPKQFLNTNTINELIIEFVGVRNYKVPPDNALISVQDAVFNDCSSIVFHIDNVDGQQTTTALKKYQVLFPKDLKRLYPDEFNNLIQQELKKKIK